MSRGKCLDGADETANFSTWNTSLIAPQNTGVPLLAQAPKLIERLKVSTIISYEHTIVLGSKQQLFFIAHALTCSFELVNRDHVKIAEA